MKKVEDLKMVKIFSDFQGGTVKYLVKDRARVPRAYPMNLIEGVFTRNALCEPYSLTDQCQTNHNIIYYYNVQFTHRLVIIT